MAKEVYKIREGRESGGTTLDGVQYVFGDDLSQTKLKKLFKAGVKSVICEYSEEKAKKSEGKEEESTED